MLIVVSPRVRDDYATRIREIAAAAELAVPALGGDGAVAWSHDPAAADVCCFSEDLWQDAALRTAVLPQVFRIERLKWFHTFSAGTDSPAFRQIVERGTVLTNSSGASAPSIAQYVLAMMLHRVKRMDDWHAAQQRREWAPVQTSELTGQTAGIIGTGAIGTAVARLAQAFGMRVLGMRRSEAPAAHVDETLPRARLRELLQRSDFVVLACPLTSETERLIGEDELRAMKPTATLINVARGRIVDEAALITALREDWIAGACLDVFATEPLPAASPLWSLPNAIVTPHNSGYSPLNNARAMAIFLDNLGRFVRGEPLRNVVELE